MDDAGTGENGVVGVGGGGGVDQVDSYGVGKGVSRRREGEGVEGRTGNEELVGVLLSVAGRFGAALPERVKQSSRCERGRITVVLLLDDRVSWRVSTTERKGEQRTYLSKQRIHLARKTRLVDATLWTRFPVVAVGEVV